MPPVSKPPAPSRSALREIEATPRPRASAELTALLAQFDLVVDHPAACHAEAATWLAAPGLDDPQLQDLEHLPFVTIDNDDSKDLDQALFIEAIDNSDGGHVVWYALADAAYYVRPGSALFAESLVRGASYYLPGLVVPMLPPSLSEGLVSLNEAVPRRALVFRVALDASGEVTSVSLERARIKSKKKLSYRLVQLMWDGLEPLPDTDFKDSLLALRIVGAQRIALAEARQVVRYQRVEVDVGVSSTDGFVAFEARRYETDRCNEQISLLVNVEGARLLARHVAHSDAAADPVSPALQAVFRVHPAPLPDALTAFARMTASIAAAHREPGLAWSATDESLAHWLDRIALLPESLRGVVLALQRQALLLNQRSMFSAEPGLHYGVGAPCYARFTSPMREVVGIFTHKEALEIMGLSPSVDEASDEVTRSAVIESANRSKDLQHQLTKAANQLVIADMLGADLALPLDARPRRAGTLVGLAPDKAYVVLDDPPLELKVYARDLGTRPHLSSDASALTIERKERTSLTLLLGDRLTLVATAYDATRDRFALAIV